MATFSCPDCKNNVSLSADKCPKCGRPVTDADCIQNAPKKPRSTAKKLLYGIIIFFVFVFLAGRLVDHGNKAKNETNKPSTSVTAQNKEIQELQDALQEIITLNANNHGLIKTFGQPTINADEESIKKESFWIDFPKGPVPLAKAAAYSQDVCRAIAIAFLARKREPFSISVRIRTPAKGATGLRNDLVNVYGVARWYSDKDRITWTPEK